jgi:hypothetical protein
MSVKIARLRSGEDIIADIKEIIHRETEKVISLNFTIPYMVGLEESVESMFSETGTSKISSPRVRFFPWMPLAKDNSVYIDPSEVICIYDPYKQVLEQYEKLKEAIEHGGGDDGSDSTGFTDQIDFVEATGAVPDWEGN